MLHLKVKQQKCTVFASGGSLPMLTEPMQFVNLELGIHEEVGSTFQGISLQVAYTVIHNPLWSCKAHI